MTRSQTQSLRPAGQNLTNNSVDLHSEGSTSTLTAIGADLLTRTTADPEVTSPTRGEQGGRRVARTAPGVQQPSAVSSDQQNPQGTVGQTHSTQEEPGVVNPQGPRAHPQQGLGSGLVRIVRVGNWQLPSYPALTVRRQTPLPSVTPVDKQIIVYQPLRLPVSGGQTNNSTAIHQSNSGAANNILLTSQLGAGPSSNYQKVFANPLYKHSDSDSDSDSDYYMSSTKADGMPTYRGTPGVSYTKFKNKFQHHLIKNIVSKDKDDKIRQSLFKSTLDLVMEEYTPAAAWLSRIATNLWENLLQPGETGYVQGQNKVADTEALVHRFWRLADAEFKKATKSDLLEWHNLFQKPDESPAAFGARFLMYKELIEKQLPIPCDWTTFIARLDDKIALAVGTHMDTIPEAQQTIQKAIEVAESMWSGIKLREFVKTMTPNARGKQRMPGSDEKDSKPSGKWCPLHKTRMHDATECVDMLARAKARANSNVAQVNTKSSSSKLPDEAQQLIAALLVKLQGTSANVKVNPNAKFNNVGPPSRYDADKRTGGGPKVQCSCCGSKQHSEERCFIAHPDIAPDFYLGPRLPVLRELWEKNRAKLGLKTIKTEAKVHAVQANEPSSSGEPSPEENDALLAELLSKFQNSGAYSGVVYVEAHAKTMNHQEMPLGFELLDTADTSSAIDDDLPELVSATDDEDEPLEQSVEGTKSVAPVLKELTVAEHVPLTSSTSSLHLNHQYQIHQRM